MTDVQISLIEHLDFEPQGPCESVLPCGEEAVWYRRLPCCGDTKAFCTSCKGKLIRWLEGCGHEPIQCNMCHTISDAADVAETIQFYKM